MFRGTAATSGEVANGHIYWQGPTFREGTLESGGRRYSGLLLNVDARMQQAVFFIISRINHQSREFKLLEYICFIYNID